MYRFEKNLYFSVGFGTEKLNNYMQSVFVQHTILKAGFLATFSFIFNITTIIEAFHLLH